MSWIVILKNTTGNSVEIADIGLILTSLEEKTVTETYKYTELVMSEDLKTLVTAGTIIVNDGTDDLSVADGINFLLMENIYHSGNTYAIIGDLDHNTLLNNDMIDQHPIYSVIGLEDAMDLKADITYVDYELQVHVDDFHALSAIHTADVIALQADTDTISAAHDDHLIDYSNPHIVTQSQVGLSNVDNTSDVDKPVSTAQQTALDLKSDITYTDTNDTFLSGAIDTKASIVYTDAQDAALSASIDNLDLVDYWMESENISAPNDIIPVASWTPANSGTNVDVAIQPKGTGSVLADVPDNTATGGNKRGNNSVDLQTSRNINNQIANGAYSVIGGGQGNTSNSSYTTVGGGRNNISSNDYSTIGGGFGNNASDTSSFVGGGQGNDATGTSSTVAGGQENTANGGNSFVGGGTTNTAFGGTSFIGGGQNNYVIGTGGTIAGGRDNSASGSLSFVGGGRSNIASGDYSSIAGGGALGTGNKASGDYSFIGSGISNESGGNYSFIGGGDNNITTGSWHFLGGGQNNIINCTIGAKCGLVAGFNNTIDAGGYYGFIGAGGQNTITDGEYSAIVAGNNNGINDIGNGNNFIGAGSGNNINDPYCFIGGGVTNEISNSITGRSSIVGGNNNILNNSGYSFVGGGGNHNASSNYATIVGGYYNTIVSGTHATIGGGGYNTASGNYSVIAGGGGLIGGGNTASGDNSSIVGGSYNTVSATYSSIGGGYYNNITALNSTIAGGYSNTVAGSDGAIGGGRWNKINSGTYSVIAGGGGTNDGNGNEITGDYSTIVGGTGNIISGGYNIIGGGELNTITTDYSTIVGGQNAVTNTYGQQAYSTGKFVSNGDAQNSSYTLRNTLTSSTKTWLSPDPDVTNTGIFIDDNQTMSFIGTVTARTSGDTPDVASWKVEGVVSKSSSDVITVHDYTVTVIYNPTSWTIDISEESTNYFSVGFTATGWTETIRAVADIQTSEIIFV